MRRRYRHLATGFTLGETLTIILILSALAILIFQMASRSIERAHHAVDILKMRHIHSAIVARAMENNGIAYTKQETGNSVYRQWDDPMSLCQILSGFLSGEEAWMSPSANSRHRKYRNSYAWSQARKISFDLENPEKSQRTTQIDNPATVLTVWNNFCYTLPSGFNRSETNSVGPKPAAANFHHRPWNRRTAVNWFYLDGHVETF